MGEGRLGRRNSRGMTLTPTHEGVADHRGMGQDYPGAIPASDSEAGRVLRIQESLRGRLLYMPAGAGRQVYGEEQGSGQRVVSGTAHGVTS